MPTKDMSQKDCSLLVSLIVAINEDDLQRFSDIIQQIIKDDTSRFNLIKIITHCSEASDWCNLLMLATIKRKIAFINLLLDEVKKFPTEHKYEIIGQRNKEEKNVLGLAVSNKCGPQVVEQLKSIYKESVETAFLTFIKSHPVGKDDEQAPKFYEELSKKLKFSKQKIVFIIVAHMVHTLPYFIQGLLKIGEIAAIIPKAARYVRSVEKTLNEIYNPIIRNDINKIVLQQSSSSKVDSFFADILKAYPADYRLMIIDHGGYFAPYLNIMQSDVEKRIAGIVEHTWNGHLRYDGFLKIMQPAFSRPIYSIARTHLKTLENEHVATSIVNTLAANICGGGGLNQDLSRSMIGIIGYGHVGAAVAKELLKKVKREQIIICDNDPEILKEADELKFKCHTEMTDILCKCNFIIAAANKQILGIAEFNKMKAGACVICVTSSDDQFKPDVKDWLQKIAETAPSYVTTYKRPDGTSIHLGCDGKSVNFSIGSTPHPVLHAVLGSVLAYAYNCITNDFAAPATRSSCISSFSSQESLDKSLEEIYEEVFNYPCVASSESVLVRDEQKVSRIELIPRTKSSFVARLLAVLYYFLIAPIIFLLSPLLMLFMTFNIKLSLSLGGMLAFAGTGIKHYFTIRKAYKLLKKQHREKKHVTSLIKAQDTAVHVANEINQSDFEAKGIAPQQGSAVKEVKAVMFDGSEDSKKDGEQKETATCQEMLITSNDFKVMKTTSENAAKYTMLQTYNQSQNVKPACLEVSLALPLAKHKIRTC